MSFDRPSAYEQLSLEAVARVDAVCDGFERAWKAVRFGATAPQVSTYLDGSKKPSEVFSPVSCSRSTEPGGSAAASQPGSNTSRNSTHWLSQARDHRRSPDGWHSEPAACGLSVTASDTWARVARGPGLGRDGGGFQGPANGAGPRRGGQVPPRRTTGRAGTTRALHAGSSGDRQAPAPAPGSTLRIRPGARRGRDCVSALSGAGILSRVEACRISCAVRPSPPARPRGWWPRWPTPSTTPISRG